MNRSSSFQYKYVLVLLLLFINSIIQAQKPKDGTYTYKVAFAEWGGKSMGSTVTVVIKGNAIKIVANEKTNFSGTKKGDIIEQGIILKHKKTGKYIIGTRAADIYAKEVGGCSDGPTVIDFKYKKWWTC